MRRFVGMIAAALVGLGVSAVPATAASSVTTVRHVHVHGYSITLDCTGSGGPTIILFSEFRDAYTKWQDIQQHLARHTRVCSYDRLGEGSSSKPRRTQTLASNARLLHGVLRKAGVGGRLVLVGHSIGAAVATAYARAYPLATAGLVTFDATPPGLLHFARRLIPASAGGLAKAVRQEADRFLSGHNRERLRVVRTTWGPPHSLRHTPLAVVEHGKNIYAPVGTYATPLQGHWAAGQRHLAKLSWRNQLIIATRSGHYIYVDQPRLALDVINAVAGQSRRR